MTEEVFFRGNCDRSLVLLQDTSRQRYLAKKVQSLIRLRNSLIAHKDELVVMVPTILLVIHSGLQLLGVAPGGARAAATR